MSKIREISCDCGCGEIGTDYDVFWMKDGWCTLRYDANTNEIEFHFKSLECLSKWILEKRIDNEV